MARERMLLDRIAALQSPDGRDRYEATARQVLDALLDRYTNEGIEALEEALDAQKLRTMLLVPPFNQLGRPLEIMRAFGGAEPYRQAVHQLKQQIYAAA